MNKIKAKLTAILYRVKALFGKKPQKISEEEGIHKAWYDEAHGITVATLPKFINHLLTDYEHDYGTICHAIAAGSIATAYAMNKDEKQGGITGFQAGAIMWKFIQQWNYPVNKTGLRIIDYDNLLYPQYADKFQNILTPNQAEIIKNEAAVLLRENREYAHPDVLRHWERLAQGELPFGFIVRED